MEQKYIKLSKYASNNAITYRTAWNHYKKGLIEGAIKIPSGSILVPINNKIESTIKKAALYARVSNNDRKKSLNSQLLRLENFALKNGYIVSHSVKEIASGMNDNRTKLTKLLCQDDWDILIIENKDRLTKFGFNFIQILLNKNNKEIIVLNENKTEKEDILQDLISIIYSFSARIYGLRRKKTKEEIIKFLEK